MLAILRAKNTCLALVAVAIVAAFFLLWEQVKWHKPPLPENQEVITVLPSDDGFSILLMGRIYTTPTYHVSNESFAFDDVTGRRITVTGNFTLVVKSR